MKKNNLIGSAMLLTTAVIWGFAFVAQVLGAECVSPFTFNAIRFLIGAISLVPIILIFERDFADREKFKNTVIASVLGGVALFAAAACQQIGADITGSAGVSGFITGLYTVMTPIAYLLIFKKRTAVTVWIGAVFSVLGLFCLCINDSGLSAGPGELLLFCGTFFWTAHIIIIDIYVDKVSPLKFSCGQFIVCGLMNVVVALFAESAAFSMDNVMKAGISILYCGILSAGVAYTFQIFGQKYSSSPTGAAIILSTESLFSAIGGAVFGTDSIPPIGYAGCALIFAGIVLSQLPASIFKKQKNKNDDNNAKT